MNDRKEDTRDIILAWIARRQILLNNKSIEDLVQALKEYDDRVQYEQAQRDSRA